MRPLPGLCVKAWVTAAPVYIVSVKSESAMYIKAAFAFILIMCAHITAARTLSDDDTNNILKLCAAGRYERYSGAIKSAINDWKKLKANGEIEGTIEELGGIISRQQLDANTLTEVYRLYVSCVTPALQTILTQKQTSTRSWKIEGHSNTLIRSHFLTIEEMDQYGCQSAYQRIPDAINSLRCNRSTLTRWQCSKCDDDVTCIVTGIAIVECVVIE